MRCASFCQLVRANVYPRIMSFLDQNSQPILPMYVRMDVYTVTRIDISIPRVLFIYFNLLKKMFVVIAIEILRFDIWYIERMLMPIDNYIIVRKFYFRPILRIVKFLFGRNDDSCFGMNNCRERCLISELFEEVFNTLASGQWVFLI